MQQFIVCVALLHLPCTQKRVAAMRMFATLLCTVPLPTAASFVPVHPGLPR